MPFGGRPLTYRRLLLELGSRADCRVHVQAEAGIPDVARPHREPHSGTLYYVERIDPHQADAPAPEDVLFELIEVFHEETLVAPERLRVICQRLGYDPEEIRRAAIRHE